MAVSNQNVTAENLISATVKYSNKDDANRVYDISANVRIDNGTVRSFESGDVRKMESDTDNADGMPNMANFSSYGTKALSLNYENVDEEDAKAILSAVYAFMTDVKKNVSINPVKA